MFVHSKIRKTSQDQLNNKLLACLGHISTRYKAITRSVHCEPFTWETFIWEILLAERDLLLANQTLRILQSQSKTFPKQSFHRYNSLSHKENFSNEGPPVLVAYNELNHMVLHSCDSSVVDVMYAI